jgi:hypothetical protein
MDLVSRIGCLVSNDERWITMKKLVLFALLVCLAVAGCGDEKKGSSSGSSHAAPAPTGSAS